MCTSAIKTGVRYLLASIVIAAAGAVYGLFSHGVYSYYMTYAFMIPLLCGTLPHLVMAMGSSEKTFYAKEAQLAFIATLTAGSLLKGVLDIYGTTNRLLIIYPVIAVLIAAAGLIMAVRHSGGIARILKNK